MLSNRPTSPTLQTMRVLSSRITSPISSMAATLAKSPLVKTAREGLMKANEFAHKMGNKAYGAIPGTLRPLDDVFLDRLYKDILIKVWRQVEDRHKKKDKVRHRQDPAGCPGVINKSTTPSSLRVCLCA